MEIQATENRIPLSELRKLVPAEKLRALTGKGVLKAYTLAHEGESRPKVLSQGVSQILHWPKAIISKISESVKPGTKFFARHNNDNSTEGRRAIGEVLATTVKEIGGQLSSVVVGHFPDKEESADYDVISMEANAEWDINNVIQKIGEITGIAASSSRVDSPAFPGAVQLAQIQCFASTLDGEEGDKNMTFADVQNWVKDHNVFPHQLYTVDSIKDDREFGKVFKELETLTTKNESLTSELEGAHNTVKELEATTKTFLKKDQIAEGSKMLDELLKDGYTDKQVGYIKKRFNGDSFEELNEDTLKSFIETQTKEFSEDAKFFGNDSGDSGGSDSGEGSTTIDDDPVAKAMKEMEE